MVKLSEEVFIVHLLDRYWNATSAVEYDRPVFTVGMIARSDYAPAICVVGDNTEYRQHGFSGRYLSYKKHLSIMIIVRTPEQKAVFEDEVVRIIKTYCLTPTLAATTTEQAYTPSPTIHYIHLLRAQDSNDYAADPVLEIRQVEIELDIQRDLT